AALDFDSVLRARTQLSRALGHDLPRRRWYRSKAHDIRQIEIVDWVELRSSPVRLVVARVEYLDQDPELYILPLRLVTGEEAEWLDEHDPDRIIADVTGPED